MFAVPRGHLQRHKHINRFSWSMCSFTWYDVHHVNLQTILSMHKQWWGYLSCLTNYRVQRGYENSQQPTHTRWASHNSTTSTDPRLTTVPWHMGLLSCTSSHHPFLHNYIGFIHSGSPRQPQGYWWVDLVHTQHFHLPNQCDCTSFTTS